MSTSSIAKSRNLKTAASKKRSVKSSAVDDATIKSRTRINRSGDENARCNGSRMRGQPKVFSRSTPHIQRHLISAKTHRGFSASPVQT